MPCYHIDFDQLKIGTRIEKNGYAIPFYRVKELHAPDTDGPFSWGWTSGRRRVIIENEFNQSQYVLWEGEATPFRIVEEGESDGNI